METMPHMTKKQKSNTGEAEKNVSKLSKNMEYIVQQEVMSRGLEPSLMKSNEFSHIIIKAVQDDEKMYLVAMSKRLQQCCPFLENKD
jgi:hypothetical protein